MIDFNGEGELIVTGDEVQVIVQGFDKDGGTLSTEQVMVSRQVKATPKAGFGAIRLTALDGRGGKMVNIINRKVVIFLVDGVEETRLDKAFLGVEFA